MVIIKNSLIQRASHQVTIIIIACDVLCMQDKMAARFIFNNKINIILFLFYYLFVTTASTPDWVAEFAEKQARREAEDKIKVSQGSAF